MSNWATLEKFGANEEWNQRWMKWMQNGLFIGKFWAKIVVEKWLYRWKIILVVGSKSRRNLTVGSWSYRWKNIPTVGSNPDSIKGIGWMTIEGVGGGRDLGCQITLKGEVKNCQKSNDFPSSHTIFWIYCLLSMYR